jgi:hypothetical protein
MPKAAKKRFAFKSEKDLALGAKGKDVSSLQSMLTIYGYLRGAFEVGKLCPATQRAVRRFQRFYGLKSDGVVGPITKKLLGSPRCGNSDRSSSPGGTTPSAPFVLRGCSYDKHELSFAFLNGTSDLPGNREREIVRQAFQAWEAVANLHFMEVGAGDNPDFRIAWRSGDHGDGSPFDDQGGPEGNTLAHAFFPPTCGGAHAGDLHFDEAETWIDDPSGSGILLLQVAIHEIGHLLGLSHSDDNSAIMFAFYAPDRVNLAQDDIQGITALYGERSENRDLTLSKTVTGTLADSGAEVTYELTVPANLSIKLDGPDDADFDLYVRKGAQPTVNDWDFRAFTVSADEKIVLPAEAGEQYFIMVRSFNGDGNYSLTVESA